MSAWAHVVAMGGVLGILGLSGQGAAGAAELVFLASQGNLPGARELATGFERASGHKVTVLQEMGGALEQRLGSGPADVVALGPEGIEDLVKKGRVVASNATPFMLAGLAVSLPTGEPKPDISTFDAYKATWLAAKSIGYSRGCSGQHVAWGIEQLCLTEQLKPKGQLTGGAAGPVTFF